MTIATLNGRPILASSAVVWSLREGTSPVQKAFDMVGGDVDFLLNQRLGPITLRIDDQWGGQVEFRNLVVVKREPHSDPGLSRVLISDRRIFWTAAHIYRAFNVRRTVGFRRVKRPDQINELEDIVPQIQFAAWSVNKAGNYWRSLGALKDVMKDVMEPERKARGMVPKVSFHDKPPFRLPLEGVTLDDSGEAALGRLLQHLPGFSVFLDAGGDVVFYNRTSGKESALVLALDPPIDGTNAEFISNANIRPRAYEVLFDREHEVRFDFEESTEVKAAETQAGSEGQFPDKLGPRLMQNVLPIPELFLEVDGRKLAQGTWIEIDAALRNWKLPTVLGGGTLTFQQLRQAMMPGSSLFGLIQLHGAREPDNLWPVRISYLQQHYRRTFRLPRDWWDCIKSVRPYRIAVVDTASGQRSPALAFADHAYLETRKTHLKRFGQKVPHPGADPNNTFAYFINVDGYPKGAGGAFNATTKPAPARITIVDADQGIIGVDYRIDPFRNKTTIFPSKVESGATGDPVNGKTAITHDSIVKGRKPPQLSPDHKLAVIISVVPGSPNHQSQFYKITVKPRDVRQLLGGAGLGDDNRGPVKQLRVGAGVARAFVAWDDKRSTDIENSFKLGDSNRWLKGLVINDVPGHWWGGTQNTANLNAVALSVVSSDLSQMGDRFQGSASVGGVVAGAQPMGWASEITWTVAAGKGGECFTMVSLPDGVDKLDVFSFLDASTRATILNLVQPQ